MTTSANSVKELYLPISLSVLILGTPDEYYKRVFGIVLIKSLLGTP